MRKNAITGMELFQPETQDARLIQQADNKETTGLA